MSAPCASARWIGFAIALLALLGAQEARAQTDPAQPGPLAVSSVDYDFGDGVFAPSGFPGPVELRARVHHPVELERGPFPVVVVLHGRHVTCFNPASLRVSLVWPCPAPLQPIPNHLGYDYIGQNLASHGYVVVSVSANGINAVDSAVADAGMQARAELVQLHLRVLELFNLRGFAPLGPRFVGRLDLQRVGTFGHSRGGEGVVRHQQQNLAEGEPFGIQAVLAVAPTDFSRFVINDVALGVFLPYCDGDVADLQGVHFFDDALYNLPGDPSRKHSFLIQGANHNFFNTVWTPGLFPAGGVDDYLAFGDDPNGNDPHCGPPAPDRRTAAEQRSLAQAYTSAFFRTYLGGEQQFLPLLTGLVGPPQSAQSRGVFASHQPPDTPSDRLDVNRFALSRDRSRNELGGGVSAAGLATFFGCGGAEQALGQPAQCLPNQPSVRQPHTTPSAFSRAPGLGQVVVGWNGPGASLTNALPAGAGDVRAFSFLQFRAGVHFADARNTRGVPSDFSVVLEDRSGRVASVPVSRFSNGLFFPPGRTFPVPKVLDNTIQVPLSAFRGVDLTQVARVRFVFDQRAAGALLLTDLAFSNPLGAP